MPGGEDCGVAGGDRMVRLCRARGIERRSRSGRFSGSELCDGAGPARAGSVAMMRLMRLLETHWSPRRGEQAGPRRAASEGQRPSGGPRLLGGGLRKVVGDSELARLRVLGRVGV